MGEARVMPAQLVRSKRAHNCGFCGQEIDTGITHAVYRGFDPDRSRDGGSTWGVWVTERRHMHCRPEALCPRAVHEQLAPAARPCPICGAIWSHNWNCTLNR